MGVTGRPTMSAPLPPGWSAAQDDKGKTYYFNSQTNETRWDPPPAAPPPPPGGPPPPPAAAPPGQYAPAPPGQYAPAAPAMMAVAAGGTPDAPMANTAPGFPNKFGQMPRKITCHFCNQVGITRLTYEVGTFTYVSCGGLIIFGFVCGCCLIPFCVDQAKDAHHHCQHCGNVV